MDCRVLVRFIGVQEDLDALWSEFMAHFPDAELPSVDSGEWYSVEDFMKDEYECRFEELPESELLAVDGNFLVENEPPEDILTEILERFERVYAVFKWSTVEVGIGCGTSEGWGEFNEEFADDGSDEANEISESVLGF